MQKINKILNIVTIVMFVITVVLLGLFYFGGELPNSQYVTPVYTEQLLWWSYLLFGVAIVAALVFPIARLFTRPKEAMKMPCFGSPHASRGLLSFFSGMLALLDLDPEFGPHEFAVPQIFLGPRRLGLHIFDDELAAEFVRKVRRVPDRADPLAGLCHIRFLQRELRLQPQVGDDPGPKHDHQLVIPPGFLLTVKAQLAARILPAAVLRLPMAPLVNGSRRRSA